MSSELCSLWPLVLLVSKTSPRLRHQLLEDLIEHPDFLEVLEEIFHNLYQNTLKLEPAIERKLKPNSKLVKSLSSLKENYKTRAQKRKAVRQIGGFLPILIPALTAIVAEFIRSQR